jgi:hypothetical protein
VNIPADTGADFLLPDGNPDTEITFSNLRIDPPNIIEAEVFVGPKALVGARGLRVRCGDQQSTLTNVANVVEIDLEFNQGAMDPTQVADRVAGHPTVVRAYLRSAEDMGKVTALLYVFNESGGAQIPGSPFQPADSALEVKSAYSLEERFFLKNSLNFCFGTPMGLHDPLPRGDYRFSLALSDSDPTTLPASLPNVTRNELHARRDVIVYSDAFFQRFVETKTMRILALMDYRLSPRIANLVSLEMLAAPTFIGAAYPVDSSKLRLAPDRSFSASVFDLDEYRLLELFHPNWARIFSRLAAELDSRNRLASPENQFDRIVLVTDMVSVSVITGDDATKGMTDMNTGVIITGNNTTTFAHELGHSYGLGDTYPDGWNS